MSYGIPVVATKVGGVSEVLSPDAGSIVQPGDVEGLAAAVSKLIACPDMRRRMGESGVRHVRANHSLEYLEGELCGIYDRWVQK
jgi:glycosyltransferase involved in cell wall biosynthesis